MKNILVIGSNSFIGEAFCRRIMGKGMRVVTTSRKEACGLSDSHVTGDPFNPEFIATLLADENPAIIVNFVGSSSRIEDSAQSVQLNSGVLTILVEACRKAGTRPQIITMGSAAEYGKNSNSILSEKEVPNPVSPYGFGKWIQTVIAQAATKELSLPVSVIRPFNLLGKGAPSHIISEIIRDKVKKTKNGGTVFLDDPSMTRDFISIDSTVDKLVTFVINGPNTGIYNLCSGVGLSLKGLALKFAEEEGKIVTVRKTPESTFAAPIPVVIGSQHKFEKASKKLI